MGVTQHKNIDWICSDLTCVSVTDEGTVANNQSSSNLALFPHTSSYWIPNGTIIEFDVVSVTGDAKIQILDEIGSNEIFDKYLNTYPNSTIKIKLGNQIEWWVNDTKQTNIDYYMDNSWMRFLVSPNGTLTFKNVKIYPI